MVFGTAMAVSNRSDRENQWLDHRVRTGHGTTDWFQIGKGVRQGGILSPCLTYMQNTS